MDTNIGRMIKDARTRKGLSQAELAEKVGVSQAAIGQWERGTFTPRGRNLNALADVLGIAFQPEFSDLDLPPLYEDEEKVIAGLAEKYEDVTAPRRRVPDPSPNLQEDLFIAEEGRARVIASEHKAQAGDFERAFFDLLSQVDPTAKANVPLQGGSMYNQWTIDCLTQRAVIEVKHPTSYNRIGDVITKTLWQLTVLRTFIGKYRHHVAVIRRPPLAPFPAHALSSFERVLTKLAAEADLVGIHLVIVDTPEEAVKAISELDDEWVEEE